MKKRGLFLASAWAFLLFATLAIGATFSDSDSSDFNIGTYTNTTYNGSSVVLSGENISGIFSSQIFDAGQIVSWDNISWEGSLTTSSGVSNSALYLKLDESSGSLLDSSGNGNDGVYNGALYSQSGWDGSAIGFDDSDDVINVTHDPSLDFGLGNFSLIFWVNRDDSSTDAILSKTEGNMGSSDGYSFFFTSTNSIRLRAQSDAIDLQCSGCSIGPSDGWIHVAIVGVRNGDLSFYVNGSLVDSVDMSGSSGVNVSSDYDLRIGYIETATQYFFDGDLDEVILFTRAISEQEISSHYNGTQGGLDLSVRSCDDSSCSGEVFNSVLGNSPSTLALSNNQYFQYRFDFSREFGAQSPQLFNISIAYSSIPITEGNSGTYYSLDGSSPVRSSFYNGTWINLSFNDLSDSLELDGLNLNGSYLSEIFDAEENVTWNSLFLDSSPFGEIANSTSGNVLLMHMDESVGSILDYSGNNNLGINNGASYGSEGIIDEAFSFGSGDYLEINDSSSLYSSDGLSIGLWVRDDGSNSVMLDLVSKYANTQEEWYLSADKGNSGLVRFFMYGESGTLRRDASSSDLFDGDWHFLMAVWNGSSGDESLDIYLDGVEIDSTGSDGGFDTLVDRNSSIKLGLNTALNNQDFVGLIDEFSVWNRSFTQEEVVELYNRAVTSLNLSVRSCDDSSCSGEDFEQVFGNDLFTLNISQNRYFQYLAIFESDNETISPELYNVTLNYVSISTFSNISYGNLSVVFVEPTPQDGESINETSVSINVSVSVLNPTEFVFGWNDTNYSLYDSSLQLMMNFDNLSSIGENQTYVLDLSTKSNNGVLQNGAGFADGVYGSSIDFFGDDDILIIEENDSLDFGTNDFTIELWVKRDSSSTEGLIGKADPLGSVGSSNGWSLHFTSSNNVRFRAESDNIDLTSSDSITSSDGWTHLVATADRDGTFTFYKDAQKMGTPSISGQSSVDIQSDYNLTIGLVVGSTDYYLDGSIDGLRIYNRTLSQAEVERSYYSNLYRYGVSSWAYYTTQQNLTNGNYSYFSLARNDSSYASTEIRTLVVGNVSLGGSGQNASNGTITINSPPRYIVFQRDSNNQSSIPISGTYTDSPGTIEARFNGGDWQTIDASPDGGSFSGNLTGQVVGQGELEVRFGVDSRVNDSVSDIGIGDVYAIGGQSNAEGRGTNPQDFYSNLSFNATVYREDNKWKIADDPVDTGTSIGSAWPLLANHIIENQNIPIAFISAGGGGSSILSWQKGQSNYNNLVNQIDEATLGTNSIRAVLFFQGENDMRTNAGVSGSYDDYKSNVVSMADDLYSDIGAITLVGQTNYQPGGNRSSNDGIRWAQQDAWDEDNNISIGATTYDISLGPDFLHFKTDEQFAMKAQRWWAALEYNFYGGQNGRGPVVESAEFNQVTMNLRVAFDKNLNTTTGNQGWRIVDGGTILDDTNIVGYSVSGNELTLNLDTPISNSSLLYLGSYNDALGKSVPRGTSQFQLPAEMIFALSVSLVPSNVSFINPTPENGAEISVDNFEIKSNINSNISDLWFNWEESNYTFYDSSLQLMMNFDNVTSLGENESLVLDFSRNGNTGYPNGSAFSSNGGRYRGAYYFDGQDDSIIIQDDASLNFDSGDFSLEFWAKRSNSSSEEVIISKTNPEDATLESSDGFAVFFDSNGVLKFRAQSELPLGLDSSTNITSEDEWMHIVLSVNRSGNATFYLNSDSIGSKNILNSSSINITSSYNLKLGFGRYIASDYFEGFLDELLIYNRSLSREEVSQHYSSNLWKYYPSGWEFYSNRSGLDSGDYSFGVHVIQDDIVEIGTGIRTVTVSLPQPLSVTNLTNDSSGDSWIYWTWQNPTEYFEEAIVYLDGINLVNTSSNFYNSTGLEQNTSYTITIHTKDEFGTVNDTDVNLTASTLPDSKAPVINSIVPANDDVLSSGTSSQTIVLSTDEIAICRYATSDISWSNMTSVPITNSTYHNLTVTGLSNGASYDYYFLCEDRYGNRMSSSQFLRFSVASSSGGNNGGSGGGGGGGGGGGSSGRGPQILPKDTGREASIGFSTIEGLNVREGMSEEFTIQVVNEDLGFLNSCRLEFLGAQSDWFTQSEEIGLSRGESYTYIVIVDVPRVQEPSDYLIDFFVVCEEGRATNSFELSVYRNPFDISIEDYQRDDEELVVYYNVMENSGRSHDLKISFSLLDYDGLPLYLAADSISLEPHQTLDRELRFELPKDSFGEFILLMDLNDGETTVSTTEEIFLPSGRGLTGLAISDSDRAVLSVVGLVILVTAIVFASGWFIRLHRKRRKRIHFHKRTRKVLELEFL